MSRCQIVRSTRERSKCGDQGRRLNWGIMFNWRIMLQRRECGARDTETSRDKPRHGPQKHRGHARSIQRPWPVPSPSLDPRHRRLHAEAFRDGSSPARRTRRVLQHGSLHAAADCSATEEPRRTHRPHHAGKARRGATVTSHGARPLTSEKHRRAGESGRFCEQRAAGRIAAERTPRWRCRGRAARETSRLRP
jgi:hypothetical protein